MNSPSTNETPTPEDLRGERWGWELRTPESPDPTPFDEQPPGPGNVTASWSRRLAASREKSDRGWYAHVRRWSGVMVVGVLAALSGSLPEPYSPYVGIALWLGTLALVYVAVRPMVLPFYGDLRYQRWRQKVLAGQQQVQSNTRGWAERRQRHQQLMDAQAKPERWTPLRPLTTQRVDVYGGDPPGAEALLLSVAGSILQGGNPVTVADFSQDGVCHALVQRAISERRDVFAAMLPQDLPSLGLLDGLTSEDIGGVVAEAVHVSERERSAGGDRTLDTTLMDQVAGCLEGPLTFTRLHQAVTALTQETRPEGVDREEYGRLRQLMGQDARKAMESRLFRLNAALQRLSALEPDNVQSVSEVDTGGQSGPHPRAEQAQLIVWDLSERVGDVGGELLAHAGFQVLQHRLRLDRVPEGRTLILLGADRFRRTHIERLDQLARRRGVRLVCFFRHLREDSIEVLGGGEAVVLMRLGNAKEAEAAATFIGKDHRLVLSQFTVQHSSSLSTTVGTNTSESTGENQSVTKGKQWSRTRSHQYGASGSFPHDNRSDNRGGQKSWTTGTSVTSTTGTSESEQTGTSESRSAGYQRVYEFVVEPRFLQSLSSTSFILVDPRDPGSPRIGDTSPELDDEMYSLVKGDQVNPAAAVAQATAGRTAGLGGAARSGTGPEGSPMTGPRSVPVTQPAPGGGTPQSSGGQGATPAAGQQVPPLEPGPPAQPHQPGPAGPPGPPGPPAQQGQPPQQPGQPGGAQPGPPPAQPAESPQQGKPGQGDSGGSSSENPAGPPESGSDSGGDQERRRGIAAPGTARPPSPY